MQNNFVSVKVGSLMSRKSEWLTTKPSPRSRATGFDAGVIGWKLHIVEVTDDSFSKISRTKALCGLVPKYGWSLDLFIEDKCVKCKKKMLTASS